MATESPAVRLPELTPPGSRGGTAETAPKKDARGMGNSQSEPAMKTLRQRKTEAFIERQNYKTRDWRRGNKVVIDKLQARRGISESTCGVLDDCKDHDDMAFQGAHGKEGFKIYLIKKFGSLVNGWRHLDTDQNGILSHGELCQQLRRLGYHGNLKKLWAELDVNGNGHVSLSELDAETGRYVGSFKLALAQQYGDLLTGWRECIDLNGDGRIQEQEICDAVKRLGLDLNGKKLFKMLLQGPKGIGLSLIDFDPDSWQRWVTGDIHGYITKAKKEFMEDLEGGEVPEKMKERNERSGGVRKLREQLLKAEKAEISQQNEDIKRMTQQRAGLHSIPGFKLALTNRCGSLLGAWRESLDLDGNGRLTFGEFCQALQRLGMFGEIKKLWNMLDTEKKGYILFGDLDPETDKHVAALKAKLKESYGNMLVAWTKGMDVKGSGCVNEAAFVEVCQQVGYDGDARKLFKKMQPDETRKFLTLKDFDTQAFQALSRADFRMLSEDESPAYGGRGPMSLSFHERQESGFYWNIRRAWDKAERDEFARACRYNHKEFVIDTVEEFELLCRRNFGSMMGAWRLCLDSDGNGKLTLNEWCAALRRIGYTGDFKALFKKYDHDNKGYILIRDLDPAADAMIKSFLATLGEKFGSIDHAWTQGFHKDPHEGIEKEELRAAAEAMGWEGDVNKLFVNLQPMPGRMLLSIWDIDPECSRKRARGEVATISSPRDPTGHPLDKQAFGSARSGGSLSPSSTMGSGFFRSKNSTLLESRTNGAQKLRKALRSHYGSTMAGWRAALDPKLTGQVSFGTLVIKLEECAFPRENVKGLWEELSRGTDKITFADVDAEASHLLDTFRDALLQSASCLTQAWRELLDVNSLTLINEREFSERCRALGISDKSVAKLFPLLCPRKSKRQIGIQDLLCLMVSAPAADRPMMWNGSEPKEEPKVRTEPSPLDAKYKLFGGKPSPKGGNRAKARPPAEAEPDATAQPAAGDSPAAASAAEATPVEQ